MHFKICSSINNTENNMQRIMGYMHFVFFFVQLESIQQISARDWLHRSDGQIFQNHKWNLKGTWKYAIPSTIPKTTTNYGVYAFCFLFHSTGKHSKNWCKRLASQIRRPDFPESQMKFKIHLEICYSINNTENNNELRGICILFSFSFNWKAFNKWVQAIGFTDQTARCSRITNGI